MGPAFVPHRQRFAVQDHLRHGQPPDDLHDLGNSGGDVVEPAGEDANVAAGLVDLHTGAVELVLEGGAGNDNLDGGAGTDILDLSASSDAVTVDLSNAGAQLISASQGTDTLSNIENVSGSAFADDLTGDAAANTLTGNAGADTMRRTWTPPRRCPVPDHSCAASLPDECLP